jgi:hypothetical protein
MAFKDGDEAIVRVVSMAVAAALKEQEIATPAAGQGKGITDASKYFTVTYLQSILGIAALIVVWSGMIWSSHNEEVAKSEAVREHLAHIDFQNDVSIKDRSDLHSRQDTLIVRQNESDVRVEQRTGAVNERLAAIEAALAIRHIAR